MADVPARQPGTVMPTSNPTSDERQPDEEEQGESGYRGEVYPAEQQQLGVQRLG
jgi:hypothetical protein